MFNFRGNLILWAVKISIFHGNLISNLAKVLDFVNEIFHKMLEKKQFFKVNH